MALPDIALLATQAEDLDKADILREFRQRFYVPKGIVYLDGNSLGLLSIDAEQAVMTALQEWKEHAVEGWSKAAKPWFTLASELGRESAHLVGAEPKEVAVTASTTTNLHSLLATFYRPSGKRTKILADRENFPSDLYALASHLHLHGRPHSDLIFAKPDDEGMFQEDAVVDLMTDEVALILLPSVWYKSGQLADIARLTRAAHERDIIIGFDCCHSIGVVPHELHRAGVDFAVWCNYKYLNAGPGATAGLYVHERRLQKPVGLAGWFGSNDEYQFDMAFPQRPAEDATRWQISTPPVLSTVAIRASLAMVQEAGIQNIREKSLKQTDYLRELLERRIIGEGLGGHIATPREAEKRGGHIAFTHPESVRLSHALRANGVIPDLRPPDVLRFAPIPLYTSYQEIWQAIEVLHRVLSKGEHFEFATHRDTVS